MSSVNKEVVRLRNLARRTELNGQQTLAYPRGALPHSQVGVNTEVPTGRYICNQEGNNRYFGMAGALSLLFG